MRIDEHVSPLFTVKSGPVCPKSQKSTNLPLVFVCVNTKTKLAEVISVKTIKFTLEDKEKEKLEQLADSQGMPLSKYIRATLQHAVFGDEDTHQIQSLEVVEEAHNVARERCVKIYLSDAEYEAVQKGAGAKSLSTYAREILFSKAGSKYVFDIKTGDIEELNETMAEINMHVDGFIGALRFRNDILPADIARLENLLNQINTEVSAVSKELYENRENIRKNGLKELSKRISPFIK